MFKFRSLDGKSYGLTLLQKSFCDNYLEFNTNGTEAVLGAGYKCEYKGGETNFRLAASIASENLQKPSICAYISKELDKAGYNDRNIDKHHWFLINQFADLTNKRLAIDMFYKKYGKYAPEKHELEGTVEVIEIVKYSEPDKNGSKQDENSSKQDKNT